MIYLASASKARKQILKEIGINFRVIKLNIKEEHKATSNYPALVKRNALLKLNSASKKIKKGIIITADTIVVKDKKIYGKPTDLNSAISMLKKLCCGPSLVYTGLAVMDKEKNKILVDYEKTKVYMDKLTIEEIKNYFKHTTPLDKAGAFDIRGRGAFFIKGIEGCFYNVVGLPLRKLYQMFKKINKDLLLVIFCLGIFGCATEYNLATGRQETYFYSFDTEREIKLGKQIAKEIEKKYKLYSEPLMEERIKQIGKKIVAVSDRKEIDYEFRVLDDLEINAFALPGGFIYVNRGLIENVKNDDELAGVLAHEVAHIVCRHSIKKLQAIQGYSLIKILMLGLSKDTDTASAADLVFSEILLGYSRQDELMADTLAARYCKKAGFNAKAMIDFLKRLQETERYKPAKPKSYFKTHPYVPDRIRIIKEELGESLDFTDYINIEEKKRF